MTIYTVGHSTRTFREFLGLLRAHKILRIADIRTVPRSRRHPHFSREVLGPALRESGIGYEHLPDLGGLRHPRRDSPNVGWRNRSFRGYADHMQTEPFERGIQRLLGYAAMPLDAHDTNRRPGEQESVEKISGPHPRLARTAVMCAEAIWWKCHRALLADALLVRGVTVCHILSTDPPQPHQLCEFARTDATTITYLEDNRRPPSLMGTETGPNRSK